MQSFFSSKKKVFIETGTRYSGHHNGSIPEVKMIPLIEKFQELIAKGSNSDEFQNYLIVPEFKKLYMEIMKGFVSVFKSGDLVWMQDYESNGIRFFTVGPFKGIKIKNECNIVTGEPEPAIAIREFIENSNGRVRINAESKFKPISDHKKWEQGKKAMFEAKKKLKDAGATGGYIFYSGNVYKF